MSLPDYPVALGVIRQWDTDVYESVLTEQVKHAEETNKVKSVNDLLTSGNTFKIE
jgi:2-oxoglutarate ferredoxin oxidoreductase subunit beta